MKQFSILLAANIVASCFSGHACAATAFQFTRIAQTQPGGITYFNTFALNNSGQVAYTAGLPNGDASVFRWTAGQTLQLATEGDPYEEQTIAVPDRLDMNDSGTVAFSTLRCCGNQSGIEGIFRTDGNGLTKMWPLQPQFSYRVYWLNLNNDGSVIYERGGWLEKSDGQSIQMIYSDDWWAVSSFPRVNNAGDVVFSARTSQDHQMVLVKNGVPMTIADHSSNPRFEDLGEASINNHGTVVFIGQMFGDSEPNRLFSFENGQLTQLIDPTQTAYFAMDGMPGINDSGQIAFLGYTDQIGVYVGLNRATDALVRTNELFDSKIVSGFIFYGDINNAGQVVFEAMFADGSSGLYLATPVPEPTTISLACLALVFVCARRRSTASG